MSDMWFIGLYRFLIKNKDVRFFYINNVIKEYDRLQRIFYMKLNK
jgi:hypothetical protein